MPPSVYIVWPNLFAIRIAHVLFNTRYSVICNVVYLPQYTEMHNTPHSARMSAMESIPVMECATRLVDAGINARADVSLLDTSTTTTTTTATIYRYRF